MSVVESQQDNISEAVLVVLPVRQRRGRSEVRSQSLFVCWRGCRRAGRSQPGQECKQSRSLPARGRRKRRRKPSPERRRLLFAQSLFAVNDPLPFSHCGEIQSAVAACAHPAPRPPPAPHQPGSSFMQLCSNTRVTRAGGASTDVFTLPRKHQRGAC